MLNNLCQCTKQGIQWQKSTVLLHLELINVFKVSVNFYKLINVLISQSLKMKLWRNGSFFSESTFLLMKVFSLRPVALSCDLTPTTSQPGLNVAIRYMWFNQAHDIIDYVHLFFSCVSGTLLLAWTIHVILLYYVSWVIWSRIGLTWSWAKGITRGTVSEHSVSLDLILAHSTCYRYLF